MHLPLSQALPVLSSPQPRLTTAAQGDTGLAPDGNSVVNNGRCSDLPFTTTVSAICPQKCAEETFGLVGTVKIASSVSVAEA